MVFKFFSKDVRDEVDDRRPFRMVKCWINFFYFSFYEINSIGKKKKGGEGEGEWKCQGEATGRKKNTAVFLSITALQGTPWINTVYHGLRVIFICSQIRRERESSTTSFDGKDTTRLLVCSFSFWRAHAYLALWVFQSVPHPYLISKMSSTNQMIDVTNCNTWQ